MTSPESWKITL